MKEACVYVLIFLGTVMLFDIIRIAKLDYI